ncbi:penicillin-binding protein 2 [Nocardioides marmoriginsengisoli]|uniref:Penicillin-binding protein 2 n=1 Tax=Nocardioides marmoriginsengisoli TaxID=661483 RepID=A0A3N0CC17_9ACTN|nr:penicillin-binding transpeptidase domain-containing protein [Nocardioides marmoriginsengisoli]RNL60791.1 penicillin-binding protein 2 [Nocardioides marmoriginsengisoli]
MNRPIRNLAIACMAMFLALMANATYLQYWQADSLNSLTEHDNNTRVKDATFSEPRGQILVGKKAIALSKKSNDRFKYQRVYPFGAEYAHIAGYFSRSRFGGIESSQNNILTGDAPGLFVNRVIDLLGNQAPQGGNVVLTLNAKAQKAAYEGLKALGNNTRGAVVAIEPATGRILAMVSSPTFNPTRMANHDISISDKAYDRLLADKLIPLNNRAIEERLPPGSTFKLVTAAAALSSGKYNPDTLVPGGASLDLPQTSKDLVNESRGSCGGNKITLTRALEVSCNVAFGAVGLKLGADALREQAEKFGFNKRDFFTDLDDPLTSQATSEFPQDVDAPQTALSAIGQASVTATPLQMAMVAAGIANNGRVMTPYLVDEIRSADLDVIKPIEPKVLTPQAITPSAASKLAEMMVAVVDNGTGRTAQIPGIKVAGKTGTAQSLPSRPPYAWFVSFAPSVNARVAVAVLIQDANVDRDAISGSGLAAPIAKSVMEAVLNP